MSAHALADGDEIWRRDVAGGADGSSPLVVGDLVVAGGNDGFVYAWDARSGTERWKADIVKDTRRSAGIRRPAPRIGDNRARPGTAASDGINLYISIFDQSRVVALDLKTGAPRWSYQTKGWIAGMPTVAEGKVFFGSQDHKVYAVDASTGKFVWSFETRYRRMATSPMTTVPFSARPATVVVIVLMPATLSRFGNMRHPLTSIRSMISSAPRF